MPTTETRGPTTYQTYGIECDNCRSKQTLAVGYPNMPYSQDLYVVCLRCGNETAH